MAKKERLPADPRKVMRALLKSKGRSMIIEDTTTEKSPRDIVIDEKMTVMLLGSGYAAVHMVLVKDAKLGEYWDAQQTGIGRYRTREEALKEALSWSHTEEIPMDWDIQQKSNSRYLPKD